jgi:hypothetical protein
MKNWKTGIKANSPVYLSSERIPLKGPIQTISRNDTLNFKY